MKNNLFKLRADHIYVYLHPERITLLRKAGLLRRRVVVNRVITTVTNQGEHSWSAALAALANELQLPEWKHARASVILAGQLMRCRVATWNDRLTLEERLALLRYQFNEVYGEVAQHWQITIADFGYGKSGLACAVDARLMDALKQMFSGMSIKLVSVRPYLMDAFNQSRKAMLAGNAWFLLQEQSLLTLILLGKSGCIAIRSHACEVDKVNLEVLIKREALQQGIEAADYPIYFLWPDNPGYKPDVSFGVVHTLSLQAQSGFSPDGGKAVAVAMCG